MNKSELQERLEYNSQAIMGFIDQLDDDLLNSQIAGKWSVGENIIHLVKSVAPVNIAMNLPKISFLIFGRASESLSYDSIVKMYTDKLGQGAKASRPYIPRANVLYDREKLIVNFSSSYQSLLKNIDKWSEEDMDKYRLPHPIIGKITMREMIYFTIYHLEHHLLAMKAIV